MVAAAIAVAHTLRSVAEHPSLGWTTAVVAAGAAVVAPVATVHSYPLSNCRTEDTATAAALAADESDNPAALVAAAAAAAAVTAAGFVTRPRIACREAVAAEAGRAHRVVDQTRLTVAEGVGRLRGGKVCCCDTYAGAEYC